MFDLIVIGGGSAGVRAANTAASLGAKVLICESSDWGGTCVNLGCVPKKLYHYLAHAVHNTKQFSDFFNAPTSALQLNWQAYQHAKDQQILKLNKLYKKGLKDNGCTLIQGTAALKDQHTVTVNGTSYQAKHIILATGGKPFVPDFKGSELALTSDDVFALKALPTELLIVGGGYIGCEFASLMTHLGVKVTLCSRSKPLAGFDQQAADFLIGELKDSGVTLKQDLSPCSIEKLDSGALNVCFDDGEQDCFDAVLLATGRSPNTASLNLEAAQIKVDQHGLIQTNENFETSAKHIYALGDLVANQPDLTPVAIEQGMWLAKSLFGSEPPLRPFFNAVATAVFTLPQYASVGSTEEQLIQDQCAHEVYTNTFTPLKYAVGSTKSKAFVKLLCRPGKGELLGVHVIAAQAAELIQGFSAALNAGATKAMLDQTVGVHPTAAEELVTLKEPSRVQTTF